MDWSSWMIGDRAWERVLSAGVRRHRCGKACAFWRTMQGSVMQLHSANDQMTAHVNMAFSRPQNYDSLQHATDGETIERLELRSKVTDGGRHPIHI
jgi:hypothetical protein